MNEQLAKLLQAVAGAYKLPDPWELEGDRLIAGDFHAPLYSLKWLRRIALVGMKELSRPRSLTIGGDLFDLSNFSIYRHAIPPPTWASERDSLKTGLDALLTVFDRIDIIMGNHDRRIQLMTAGAFEETDILAMITTNDKVRMSPLGYCYARGGDISWLICHPKNYSLNRLIVTGEIALKYQMNVIGFHEHHLALGWDRYARYCIINGGCIVDPAKLAYVSLDPSKAPVMQNGFVLLRDGIPTLFGDSPVTDWSKYDG